MADETAVTPRPLEGRAHAKWVRMTARKVRLVANLVRGRSVSDAVSILQYSLRRASTPPEKAVRSAMANLHQSDAGAKLDPSEVIVQTIFVNEGPVGRRFMPRAHGRAYRVMKKTAHLTVVVAPGKAMQSAVLGTSTKRKAARKSAKPAVKPAAAKEQSKPPEPEAAAAPAEEQA